MLKKLAKESLFYGVAGGANRFIGVLLVPVYTRFFAPDQYGLLDLLMSSMTILVLLAGMQIESGVGRSYYEAKDERTEGKLIGTGISLYIPSCILWAILLLAAYKFWFASYPQLSWGIAIALAVSLLPNQIVGLALYIFRLEHRPIWFAVISLGDVLTGATLSILAVLVLKMGVEGVIWGLVISKVVWSTVSLLLLRRSITSVFDKRYAKEILYYGVPIVPSSLTKWGQNYANRFILVAFLNLADVGIFSVAVKLASIVLLVDTAFRMAWDPLAIELMGKQGSESKYSRMLSVYILVMFSLAAFISAVGTPAVGLIAGSRYIEAGRFVGFISIGLIWSGAMQIMGLGNNITRKTYRNIAGFGVGAGFNVVVLLLTVKLFGLLAAGMTFMFGAMAAASVLLFTAQRSHKIPYSYSTIAFVMIESIGFAFWTYFNQSSGVARLIPGGYVLLNIIIFIMLSLFGAIRVRHELKTLPAS
ncbi:MAG: oligosaccharide flippase family protein [Bacteroidetes bacterium]|nr:oligosaccharide flippase family protein [Bacteroidota bacterium]